MKQLKTFFILWITQSLSALGSAMTAFALTLRLYEQTGSALMMFILAVAGTLHCLVFGKILSKYSFREE